ncbi:ABC transporter permease [Epilithonimonas xixisoli]|uniref:Putative ABC transport system permease protein n=1 Tax=Epilithonimonas xixisoli TaxID=1476462 RepID=A0A4R8IDI1_9FLAO|nr:ABC transporter permease [Epilithonimonas xixisoli]TDX82825.1 putative ABC transport system permease protein [Epilithonimonas xixisoli]
MFDLDRWQEIFSSIRSNVLRTVLSGFTVALGLFIFIVLFGIGNGLNNSFAKAFTRDATNLIMIWAGKTTVPYAGLQSDRTITFNNDDFDAIVKESEGKLEYASPRYQTSLTVKYGKESGGYQINGVLGDEKFLENRTMIDGRYINERDNELKQNVASIGRMVWRDLIRDGNPIGKDLEINGTMFKVVGVFSDPGGDWDERHISVPLSTLQQMKKSSDTISTVMLSYNPNMTPEEGVKYGDQLEKNIRARHQISPEDQQGIRINNNAKNTQDSFAFLFVITIVVGFIGLGTLLAGIIGISNIMVYIIKERTKEIGVRKAIGAKPAGIVALILQESIVITVISGIIGVGLGVLTLKLIGNNLEEYFITEPSVGWGLIAAAFFCLVLSGAIAGFVPAYKASKIKPIEALRTD